MESTIRQFLLQKERNLQIQRCGIYVQYNRGQQFSFPCFAFDPSFTDTMKKYLSDKQPIIFYFPKNFTPVLNSVDQQKFYVESNGLFCQDRQSDNVFRHGYWYIAVKNNPTIALLSRVLNNNEKINPQIYNFINDPSFNVLSQNPKHKVQDWIQKGLNQSQKQILQLVNNQRIAFVKGPPGCGKTKTIARIALFFAKNQCPVLVGAVSNAANLTILNSLLYEAELLNLFPEILLYINKQSSEDNKKHPPAIRKLTYRYKLVQNFLKIDKSLTEEGVQYLIDKVFKNKQAISNISKEHSISYFKAIALTLAQSHIVIATTTSSTKMDLTLKEGQKFKPYISILDEAAQASWADACCFLIRNVQKMVFIGDENQLTPTVISNDQILKETMFTKLYMKNPKYFVLLNEQYRMHPNIFEFPNMCFYQKKIKNGITQKDRQSPIPYFKKYPLSFINCQQREIEEIQPVSGKKNFWNEGQIDIIHKLLNFFPVEQYSNIGIISPYQQQINKIRQSLPQWAFQSGLTIKTCDGYQGSEKQYIFFSCVRSNQQGKIGFCDEKNRLNVSITRAKRGLVLIGNKQTFLNLNKGNNIWHDYLAYLQNKNLIIPEKQLSKFQIPAQFPQIINIDKPKPQIKYQPKVEIDPIPPKVQQPQQKNDQNDQKSHKIQLKVILIPQDDEQQVFKVYKDLKKKLKSLSTQLKNQSKLSNNNENQIKTDIEIQKQLEEINQTQNQLQNLIKNGVKNKIQSHKNQPANIRNLQALQRQISFYEQQLKKSEEKSEQNQTLQANLNMQTENIISEMSKSQQINRKEIQNLMKCIDLSIAWCLYSYQ